MNPQDDKRLEQEFQSIEEETQEPPKIDSTDTEDRKDTTVRDFVEDILNSGATLFHDQYHDAYIAYEGNGSHISKINSKISKLWLASYSYKHLGKVVTTDTTNRIMQTLAAKAYFEGEQYELEVRSVRNAEGLWYDLGSSAVRIVANRWEVTDQPPIVFKRFSHQKAQVVPTDGGDIRLLLKYINITDEYEQLLFLVYVITAFIPGYPHPLLILHGAQGAGKTTPMKVIKELVDPSELSGLSTPKNIEVFVQTASHHSFLFYDNLSKMPEWFSDALARAATGDSFSKRELYSDDDDVIYRFQKTIALNGINQVVYKSDLLDRSILVNLERISPENRKEYQVFWAEFEIDRPAILGAIFDILAVAIALYPSVNLTRLPRMADFTRWGYAIAQAAGYSGEMFLRAYKDNIAIQHDEAVEANPVAKVIIELMQNRDEWQGTPAMLYDVLYELSWKLNVNQSHGWPKDAARLGRILTPIVPNLNAKGIELERTRSDERTITIRKIADATDNADLTTTKSKPDDDGTTATSAQERML